MTTTNTTTLAKLPKLPRKAKAKTATCGCGCGAAVSRSFAPGHDARLHGWVLRIERGVCGWEALPDATQDAVVRSIGIEALIEGTPEYAPVAAGDVEDTDERMLTQEELDAVIPVVEPAA